MSSNKNIESIKNIINEYQYSLTWPILYQTKPLLKKEVNYDIGEYTNKQLIDIENTLECKTSSVFCAVLIIMLQYYNDREDVGFTICEKGINCQDKNFYPLRISTDTISFAKLVSEIEILRNEMEKYYSPKDAIINSFFQEMIVSFEVAGQQSFRMHDYLSKEEGVALHEYYQLVIKCGKFEITFFLRKEISDFSFLINHLRNIIESVHNNVVQIVREIKILDNKEFEKIVNKINKTESIYSTNLTLHGLIEVQATKTPNNTAIVYDEIEYTYDIINKKANYLANKLVEENIRKKEYIPVLMNKCIELPITLLAVMKSGAAFVPIDTKQPQSRILEILDDINPPFILVDKANSNNLATPYKTIPIIYEELHESTYQFKSATSPEDPIYVIYTSGSTGKPKGAINKHSGIINRFLYMNTRYNCTKDDVILLTSNHVFDAAIWQIFWPLINGLKTIIPTHSKSYNIIKILNLIEKYKVTITDFIPSVAKLLTNLFEIKKHLITKAASLRQLLIGGEAMIAQHMYSLKEYLPSCSITNTYGPSETSIGTVFYELPEKFIPEIPIGKPISNVKVLILNRNKQISPEGCVGELYLGGICVGLGYLNDENKTNEVFTTIPCIYNDKEIFYKTGDLVRYGLDGNLYFIGRVDDQIKINGVRIELQEIEKKILSSPFVKDVTVLPFNLELDKKVLCAYVIPKAKNVTDFKKDLINYLLDKLPQYMIPSYFMILKEFPLTMNGKINKKELPSPEFKN